MPAPDAVPAPTAPRELVRLTLLGALIGLPAGAVAFAFITVVHWLETWLWDDLPDALGVDAPPWWLVLGLPTLGGLLVYLARRLPGDGGHAPINGVSMGVTPTIDAGSIALAALATLPFGLVLGPEGPLIALGGIVATALTARARMAARGRAALATAGSGAAVATLFGGPIVAGVFLLEGGAAAGIGAAAIPLLLPALAASAVGYTLVTGLGDWSGVHVAGLVVPDLPTYDDVLVRDMLVAVVVGVLAALVARGVRTFAGIVAQQESRIGRLPLLLLGGLVVGGLALVGRGLGADSQDVLFSGQNSIAPLVASSGGVVLVLLIAKAIGYAVTMGAGFRGGPIFPAIFLGIALATFAVVAFDMSPTAAIAIGTAGGMTAMTRMVISPIVFAGLLVGRAGLDALTLATLATVGAWLTASVIDYRLSLRRNVDEHAAQEHAITPAPAGAGLVTRPRRPQPDDRS